MKNMSISYLEHFCKFFLAKYFASSADKYTSEPASFDARNLVGAFILFLEGGCSPWLTSVRAFDVHSLVILSGAGYMDVKSSLCNKSFDAFV